MCLTAFGQEDLATLWEACQPAARGEEEVMFEKAKWRMVDRVSLVTLVVGPRWWVRITTWVLILGMV